VIAAVTRRRSSTPAPEPVAATTSAVAALARAAVGATGRTLDSADEIVPTRGSTGFAATLARAAVNEPALPEQIFAPFAEAIAHRPPPCRPTAPASRSTRRTRRITKARPRPCSRRRCRPLP
jgi:flagellar biosynthesis protein FlhF